MDNLDRPRLEVLLFAPEPSHGGGVVAYDALLRSRLSPTVDAEQFLVGRRPGVFGRSLRMVVPIYDALRLVWRLMTHRHDVYHLNPSLVPRATLREGLFLVVLRLFRRPVLVFIRGWDGKFYRSVAQSAFRRFLFRSVYGYAARILVLGTRFADDLAALGIERNRIHTVSTMFDGDVIRSARRRRTDSGILVVFLARFIAAKGMYELLEAFRQLSDGCPDISMVMAGDGPELQAARDWCVRHNLQYRVQFPGHIEGKEKAQLLADADIFALPTYHGEGCPNALLEAMGAGLPVIVTAVGGIPDIVQHGINGLVIESHDSNAIAQSILQLANDPSQRAEIGKRNREIAWQKYEAKEVSARLESQYRAITRSPQRSDR